MVVLLLLLVSLLRLPPEQWSRARSWGTALQNLGPQGVLLLLIVGTLTTAVGLPRQLVAFVAGFAYGVAAGLLVSVFAAILGCTLTFLLSRTLLRGYVQTRFPQAVQALDRFVASDAFLKVLVLRLQPLGTNLLTNLCAGLTGIKASTFLAGSLVGFVPQMLVFNLVGSGVRIGSGAQLGISAVLLLVSLLLGVILYRRHVLE